MDEEVVGFPAYYGYVTPRRYVPIAEAAKRMELTVTQVRELVERGALRAWEGHSGLFVEPAILSGAGAEV